MQQFSAIRGFLRTTTSLRNDAQKFFSEHEDEINYSVINLSRFPSVKCRTTADGQKLFSLPFDEDYFTAVGDKYTDTVAEAVASGFKYSGTIPATQENKSSGA